MVNRCTMPYMQQGFSCTYRVVKDPNTQAISIASTVLKVQAKVSNSVDMIV